ncbi:DUF4383 domain-containing protein [Haloechinothrix sp. LS1_15]|uniref:DUF4383 domain-containing protein n=1 Tax=Haloechinothrix sp. LS1_15 TaxID=2652248 RepID=UPI002948AF6E|nr:DUF4383 domain-containing protein [Haloechinothrix sp. LS1_15]MDV6014663.1 DUF4383 domain-containing protein [Haloechinothrix sp. LS1_15]
MASRTDSRAQHTGHPWHTGRQLALWLICLVYLALLLAGLFAADGTLGGWNPDATVGVFTASAGLNFLYGGVVAFGIAAAVAPPVDAQFYGWVLFIIFTGLTAYGAASVITQNEGDILNIGWANVVLYALTALAGFLLGAGGLRGLRKIRASYSPMEGLE